MEKYYIATDGSKSAAGTGFGIAGKNIKIAAPVKDFIVAGVNYPHIQYSAESQPGTNNRGELLGILYALHYIATQPLAHFVIVTDSEYSKNIYTTWYKQWIMNGTFHDKKNKDIIILTVMQLEKLKTAGYNLAIVWQKAHMNIATVAQLNTHKQALTALNSESDRLAKLGATLAEPTIFA